MYPEFVHGCTNDSLAKKIQTELSTMPAGRKCFFSLDGSSHDSNQHEELLIAVDNKFIDMFFNDIYFASNLPTVYRERVKDMLTSTVLDFVTYYKGNKWGRRPMMKGKLRGTTFTGHPMRTTFGNTIRVMSYVRFALRSIEHKRIFVCGDDVMFVTMLDDANKVGDLLKQAYDFEDDPKDYREVGLG